MRYPDYLQSEEWKALKPKVFGRSNGLCEQCGGKARDTHHIKYPKDFKSDSEDNLIALCRMCHIATHVEQNARSLAGKLAEETNPDKIYLQLLGFMVDTRKYFSEGD